MGLTNRKRSGRIIGGSTLIVDGEPIFSVKKFEPNIIKKTTKNDNYREIIIPTPTPTIPIIQPPLIDTNYILTEDTNAIMTELGEHLIWM